MMAIVKKEGGGLINRFENHLQHQHQRQRQQERQHHPHQHQLQHQHRHLRRGLLMRIIATRERFAITPIPPRLVRITFNEIQMILGKNETDFSGSSSSSFSSI